MNYILDLETQIEHF